MNERPAPLVAPAAAAPEPRSPDVSGEPAKERPHRPRLPAPSIADLVFLLVAGIAAFLFGGLLFNGDGDLARHIRMGQEILTHGLVLRDVLSYTRAGAPLVPYEWLSEVGFAAAYRWAGLVGDVAVTAIALGAAYGLVTLFTLRRGASPVVAMLTGLAAAVVGAAHWAARPHIFTLIGAISLLFLLESKRRRLWITFVLFAVWANLHGGFLFGLIVIALYVVGDAVEGDRNAVARHGAMLVAASLAALVNPVGPRLYTYIFGFFGHNAVIVDNTVETMSPNFHDPGPKAFLLTLLVLVLVLGRTSRRPPARRVLVICATLAMALLWRRNIGLFSVTGLPLGALLLAADGGWFSRGLAAGEARSLPGVWSAAGAALVLLVASHGGRVAGRQWIGATFLPHRFPVAAVAAARDAGLTGRMYNDLDWGGYIELYWPQQKVFIDGQTDFFGPRLFDDYETVAGLHDGWADVLRREDVSLVVVPPTWRLIEALQQDPAWRIWYRDPTAAIAVRTSAWPVRASPAPAAPGTGP